MSNLSDLYPSGGGGGGSEVVAQTLLDHFVLLNGDAEALQVLLANDVTPASFATWISGEGKALKFTQLILAPNGVLAIVFSRPAMDAIFSSSVAMEAFSSSSSAMNALAASSVVMNVLVSSSTAITAIVASNTAMTAVAASSAAMNAVAVSNLAMTAVTASTLAMTAIAASSVAINALAVSSVAMTAVVGSNTAMNAVSASSLARTIIGVSGFAFDQITTSSMAAGKYVAGFALLDPVLFADTTSVFASNTASDAIFTSPTARLAVWSLNIALQGFQANPLQIQRQINIPGRILSQSTENAPFTYVPNGTRVILLRAWNDPRQFYNPDYDEYYFVNADSNLALAWGKDNTTEVPTSADGVLLPNGNNLGASTIAIGRTTTYANSGSYPGTNNANSNVVSAANGLRRMQRSQGSLTQQSVLYILV